MASSSHRNNSIFTINKHSFVVMPTTTTTTEDPMKFYPVLFDNLDHEDENDHYMNEQQKWLKIEEDFNLNYQFDNTLSNMEGDQEEQEFLENQTSHVSDTDLDSDDENDQISEEQVLSQRLSQLSTTTTTSDYEQETIIAGKRRRLPLTTTTTTASSHKKVRTTTADDTTNEDPMPDYLLLKNKLFDRIIHHVMDTTTTTTSINIEELRQMAFFMHKITGFHLLHHLWSVYLQAGTGLLYREKKDQEDDDENRLFKQVDRRYWPNQVKSLIPQDDSSCATTTTMTIEEREQRACEKVVEDHLREYQEKIQYYQKQLDEKKQQHHHLLHSWTTTTLEQTIQTLIEDYGLGPLRMKCHSRITTLKHQYKDILLQRQYEQHQPTDYQKQVAQRLYSIEFQLETAKSELMEYRQRVICNKPPVSYDDLEILLPSDLHTLANGPLRQQLLNRYEKLIQQTKTDLMAVSMATKQLEIDQYQTQFHRESEEILENNRQHIPNKELPTALKYFIDQRSLNMRKQLKLLGQFTIDYYLRNAYDEQWETTIHKGGGEEVEKSSHRIGFLPSLMIDPTMTHPLTEQQMKLLNRGPSYVAPCQLHLSSSSFPTIETMISKQYAPLKHQLAIIFDKYHISISRSTNLQKYAYETFKNLYAIPIPNDIYQRALYEKKLIQSIRHFLTKNNLILRRTADQTNSFYLGHRTDFMHRCHQYMETYQDHYHLLFPINEMNEQEIQEQLNKRYLLMNSELEKLFNEKRFHLLTHKKLRMKIEHVKLPYLYFLPEVSTTTNALQQVKPMMSTQSSVTSKLAHFLKQVLRPIIFHPMNGTILVNDTDFIEKLNSYTHQPEYHLHPTTLFATIDITNYYTMASHESMVHKLVNFLTDNLATNKLHYTSITTLNHVQTISIDTIKKLTELYLKNNIFYYDGKIYELTKGFSPMSFFFHELLLHVYLFAYEKFIFADPRLKTEFYARYKNQLFFTWNRSEEELKLFLATIAEKYPHIHMETSIGRSLHFLNVHLENRHGHLYTGVYHDSHIPTYTLPYVVGHPTLNHRLWFRSALIRAVRFCSHYLDFKQEEIYLEMTCLAHGYSIDFIETQLKHFYLRFNAEQIRFSLDQTVYERLRRRLFDFIHRQRTLADKNQVLDDQDYIFRFSYPYDYGSYHQFNEKFQLLWSTYLKEDAQLAHKDTKISLNTKHIYSLNALLAGQKPSNQGLLKTTKKYPTF